MAGSKVVGSLPIRALIENSITDSEHIFTANNQHCGQKGYIWVLQKIFYKDDLNYSNKLTLIVLLTPQHKK